MGVPLREPSQKSSGDLNAGAGDWLFRQGDLVLGPVPAKQLVEKLYAGEINGKTPVSLMMGGEGRFEPLSSVELFKLHVAKAEAKQRVDETARTKASVAARGLRRNLMVVAVVALIAGAGGLWAARHFAVHNPLQADADELAFAEWGISVDLPVIRVARRTDGEELVDYPGGAKGGNGPLAGLQRPEKSKSGRPEGARTSKSERKMSAASAEPDGMQMAVFDQDAINSVVAKNQKSLYPCLIEEAKRSPGLVAKIPLEFTIGNDGKVATLWVDHPQFREGALQQCMLRALQRWPFKPYEGERATVGLSFNVGKK